MYDVSVSEQTTEHIKLREKLNTRKINFCRVLEKTELVSICDA